MSRVLVLSHEAVAAELGHLGSWLEDRGHSVTRVYRETSPSLPDADVLVALGSPSSVAEGHCAAPAAREIALVDSWVTTGRPYLGICFGAQTLARATGGSVRRMSSTFRSYTALDVSERDVPALVVAGAVEPSARSLDLSGRWAVWHEDAITAPRHAERLAVLDRADSQPVVDGHGSAASPVTSRADMVFRIGDAWGLQPHIEFTSTIVERLARTVKVPEAAWRDLWEGLRDDEDGHRSRAWSVLDAVFEST